MHRNRRVPQHRFGTRRGNRKEAAAVLQRIAEMIQMAVNLFVFHLNVRQSCTRSRVPVDDPLAAVDQAFLVQFYKYLAYCRRHPLIKGKPFT
ncbi:hypothetical protein D3C86_1852220 [compost metagenome]